MPDIADNPWAAALQASGQNGPMAQRMAEELADHYSDLVAAATDRGLDWVAAESHAKIELGDAEAIARIAALTLGADDNAYPNFSDVLHVCARWAFAAMGGAAITAGLLLGLNLTLYV